MKQVEFDYNGRGPVVQVKVEENYPLDATPFIPQPVRAQSYSIEGIQEDFEEIRINPGMYGGKSYEAELLVSEQERNDLEEVQEILTFDSKPKFEAAKTYPVEEMSLRQAINSFEGGQPVTVTNQVNLDNLWTLDVKAGFLPGRISTSFGLEAQMLNKEHKADKVEAPRELKDIMYSIEESTSAELP